MLCEASATQRHVNTLVINRKLILIAPKLWFGRTHVVTINQGLEEAGYWQHNAPEWPDICLSDKHFGRRKTKCQPDMLLKSVCIVFW